MSLKTGGRSPVNTRWQRRFDRRMSDSALQDTTTAGKHELDQGSAFEPTAPLSAAAGRRRDYANFQFRALCPVLGPAGAERGTATCTNVSSARSEKAGFERLLRRSRGARDGVHRVTTLAVSVAAGTTTDEL